MTATGWLRVVLYDMRDVAFDHFETPLRYMRSSIPYFTGVLEKQAGFVSAHWGVDADEGKVAAVTRWTSCAAIEAARSELERMAADAEVHGIHREHVQNIELYPMAPDGCTEDGSMEDDAAITAETWLRVVSYRVAADDTAGAGYMAGHLADFLAVLSPLPGFRCAYWGRDLHGGTIAAVTYWESRRAIVSARPALQKLQVDADAAGVRPMDVHNIHLFAVTSKRGGAVNGSVRKSVDTFVDAVQQAQTG